MFPAIPHNIITPLLKNISKVSVQESKVPVELLESQRMNVSSYIVSSVVSPYSPAEFYVWEDNPNEQ